jgi:hypothetical protein
MRARKALTILRRLVKHGQIAIDDQAIDFHGLPGFAMIGISQADIDALRTIIKKDKQCKC